MATIAYDRPVDDFISRLNATGHVSHRAYRKTSVTVHHNAGRLSHEGVLNVWKSRPASAHFDVDRAGAVAQYVKVNEYAWAAGNTAGNQTSIHIEMANSEVGPNWTIGDATWKGTARLAGWLFAKVIGVRPSSSNFFQHEHWSATACAGPYTDKVWSKIMSEAQAAYDTFKAIKIGVPPVKHPPVGKAPAFPLANGSYFGPKRGPNNCISGYYSHRADLKAWQQQMHNRGWTIDVDGLFGDGTARVVRKFQAEKHLTVSGLINPQTWAAAWNAPL
jgi:N-acetyl-anhydromuramyl-L-alanine amidase AmpD